jgi:hypothetical protein
MVHWLHFLFELLDYRLADRATVIGSVLFPSAGLWMSFFPRHILFSLDAESAQPRRFCQVAVKNAKIKIATNRLSMLIPAC